MSMTSGLPDIFRIIDRLLALQAALHGSAAASAFVERAVLLHRLGRGDLALADARHAHRLDPANPEAMALYCRLGNGMVPTPDSHDIATALLGSPFAAPAERRLAIDMLDPKCLPLMLRQDLPLSVRLTLVQRQGGSIALEGTAPDDRVEPLGQASHHKVVALDCHLARPATGSRHLTVLPDGSPSLPVHLDAPRSAKPLPSSVGRPRARLWIIMPLKDGGRILERCLHSVLDNLRRLRGARLLLVDDGSEQPETQRLLAEWSHQPGVIVTRIPKSLGFTGAVNHGLQQIGAGPVLLLNSDIWLPRRTLPRLLGHLRDPEVGTVTPLSNNAGSVCLLGPGRATRMPDPDICERLADAAYRYNRGTSVNLPSGNGFAMMISEACLRAIGPLSGLYDSGYYEEVDFCLRASLRGWRHVAATDCFIGHEGSVTYGAEKQRLAAANYRRLVQRFPEYPARYKSFTALDPLAEPRARVLAATASNWTPELSDNTPPHPGAGRIVLPAPPEGPLVLPLRGELPKTLLQHSFRLMRLIPRKALNRCGLRLEPSHDLVADYDATTQLLLVHHRETGTPVLSFACASASTADLSDFEQTLIELLAEQADMGGKHALLV